MCNDNLLPDAGYTINMATEESRGETFDESVGVIAEKVRSEQEFSSTPESGGFGTERKRALELEKIRNELKESYGGSDDDDDDDDGTEKLVPAQIDTSLEDGGDYLSAVEDAYKERVMDLVQSAIDGGISRAVTRAQKKNDPYLVDAFHDSLAYLLHKKMQEQGLL